MAHPADSNIANDVMDKVLANMAALRQKNMGLQNHKPQPGDVTIVTFPKSGTTMLQNIVYQLVVEAGGAPASDPDGTNFTDIGDVVPWVESPDAADPSKGGARPRLFKSHMSVKHFNLDDESARYIYMYRDGLKLPGSFLDFVIEWTNPGMELTDGQREEILSAYLSRYYLSPAKINPGEKTGVGRWFQHVKGWTAQKLSNVLVLNYEKASEDVLGTVAVIDEFLALGVSQDAMERVAGKCSREAMIGDERFREKLIGAKLGWDPKGGIKVKRKGDGKFAHIKFSDAQREQYDMMLEDTFRVKTFEEVVQRIEER